MEEKIAFYFEEKGAYAPREGFPFVTRKNIAAIVKFQSQYLFLSWNEVAYDGSLVTGGIDDGEDKESAVKREVDGAIEEIHNAKEPVYCLGEIVHNKQVVEKLQNLGIKCIEKIEEAKGTTLIRAHGIPKEVYDLAEKMNIKIQDYTCPNVLKVHRIAEEFSKQGYSIFLLGAKDHPENIGTLSHCGKDCYIIEKEEEVSKAIETFRQSNQKKLLLISQTTFSLEKFHKIQTILQDEIQEDIDFVVKNTICRTTELRQKETE